MSARNKVIAGAFEDFEIAVGWKGKGLVIKGFDAIPNIPINKSSVAEYEVISSLQNKSGAETIVKGALGMAFLGPIGLLAAAGTQGTHVIAVEFKTGAKSLIEINDVLYKEFVAAMF